MDSPLISICIPAYKNIAYLHRLLDSIVKQDFRDFELVVTDDSPDAGVKDLVSGFAGELPLRYFRNPEPLGSPSNWNAGLALARGNWIKIMHDDDWFRGPESLGIFARAARQAKAEFIFSAYYNCLLENDGEEKPVRASGHRIRLLRRSPATLLAHNVIGPPSVTLFRKRSAVEFDTRLKWLVDIEFYCRYLEWGGGFQYIDRPLINIGIGSEQITRQAQLNPFIEIPEHFIFLESAGFETLLHPGVYDACWRLFRNLGIRRNDRFKEYGYSGEVPSVFKSMVQWQRVWPASWLHFGPFSKILMTLHYLFHRQSIAHR